MQDVTGWHSSQPRGLAVLTSNVRGYCAGSLSTCSTGRRHGSVYRARNVKGRKGGRAGGSVHGSLWRAKHRCSRWRDVRLVG